MGVLISHSGGSGKSSHAARNAAIRQPRSV